MKSRQFYAEAAHRYFALAERHELQPLLDMFHEDATLIIPLSPVPLEGRQAVRGFFEKLFADFPYQQTEILATLVDVESQAAITEQRVLLRDPQGKETRFPCNTNHFHFEGDKLKRVRVFRGPA